MPLTGGSARLVTPSDEVFAQLNSRINPLRGTPIPDQHQTSRAAYVNLPVTDC
jgi:hypothetical protein